MRCSYDAEYAMKLSRNVAALAHATTPEPSGEPREVAEQLLKQARDIGDRCATASALIDLGIVDLRCRKAQRAVELLIEAVNLAGECDDPGQEIDAYANLGLALLVAGQLERALELFQQELDLARAARNAFAEKTALEHLGYCHSRLGDSARANTFYHDALEIAQRVGDRYHEGHLRWYRAIQYADLGQRDEAIAEAGEAVSLLRSLKKPEAATYAEHLERYRSGTSDSPPAHSPVPTDSGEAERYAEPVMASVWTADLQEQSTGRGWLRMGISAARSMARFVGSGLKIVSNEEQKKRLAACRDCEHHTGTRCKLCGCFTSVKARLPHEHCPIGKWPSMPTPGNG